MGGSEEGRNKTEASLAVLHERVQKATKLIAELRESNYALGGEIAELKGRLASGDMKGPSDSKLADEIQTLRAERKLVRQKVQKLLERIEKLES